MHTIESRLIESRKALGLSQQALADLIGISLRSQQNYEKGERLPDAAYLAAIANAGADVLYIVTGQRSQPVPVAASLSPRIRALVDNYLNAPPEGQKIIEGTATLAAQSVAKKVANGRSK